MEFGWINVFGGVIVLLILIPNLVYAVKTRGRAETEAKIPTALTVCEQVGRYGCIVLMWLPLLVWKFGFGSAAALLFYLFGNAALVLVYYALWVFYFKNKTPKEALALAVIPALIFLLSGILLRHHLLTASAVLFGIAHVTISILSFKEEL